jgi:hypothetical protein
MKLIWLMMAKKGADMGRAKIFSYPRTENKKIEFIPRIDERSESASDDLPFRSNFLHSASS